MIVDDRRIRTKRRPPWRRRVLVLAVAIVLFVLGVALGQALNDGPPRPSTETYVRTLEPLPQEPATTGR